MTTDPGAAVSNPENNKAAHGPGGKRVSLPWLPTYGEVRHLLRVWDGRSEKAITGLHTRLMARTGTPDSPKDWTDPDTWIPARLDGADRELASAIWRESRGAVNPRFTSGAWTLVRRYALVESDQTGRLAITADGFDFLDNELGAAVALLDQSEGLQKLLELIQDLGPAPPRRLLGAWEAHLEECSSPFRSPSTARDSLRRRLNNLVDRRLAEKNKGAYGITTQGNKHIERGRGELSTERQLLRLLKKQEEEIRADLRRRLLGMDPFAFERLLKELLEAMDYQNVDVTKRSGDGGVDVIGEIELGITSVREVVQAKRYRNTVPRKDMDALRGVLPLHGALRGTLITTSRFSSGTIKAAVAAGAAPITLIDGDRLVELMIQHGLGVRKKELQVLSVDPEAFRTEDDGDVDPSDVSEPVRDR